MAKCGECKHYHEVKVERNGMTELIGVCTLEVEDGRPNTDVYYAKPDDDPDTVPCDFWE